MSSQTVPVPAKALLSVLLLAVVMGTILFVTDGHWGFWRLLAGVGIIAHLHDRFAPNHNLSHQK